MQLLFFLHSCPLKADKERLPGKQRFLSFTVLVNTSSCASGVYLMNPKESKVGLLIIPSSIHSTGASSALKKTASFRVNVCCLISI